MIKILGFFLVLATGFTLLSGTAVAGRYDSHDYQPEPHYETTNKKNRCCRNEVKIKNSNKVKVNNSTWQKAKTGSAWVKWNANTGDVKTGDAYNENNTDTNVEIHNTSVNPCGCLCGCEGGDNGHQLIVWNNQEQDNGDKDCGCGCGGFSYNLSNNNNVKVSNSTSQYASSGDAYVWGNASTGNIATGNASNFNGTSTSVFIAN